MKEALRKFIKAVIKNDKGKDHEMKTYSARTLGLKPESISREALRVIKGLHRKGYEGYIVGGGVRDLLLGKTPKDFDIATDAHPQRIRNIFRNSRIIGKRFKIVHVYERSAAIEVATFRRGVDSGKDPNSKNLIVKEGQVIRDNVYGTIEEDMIRRDFTINSMYYDPFAEEVLCQQQALQDLKDGCLRLIGNAEKRYHEDPVRMLRALRFSANLSFDFEASAQAGMHKHRKLINNVSRARLFDEVIKLFTSGSAARSYQLLRELNFFSLLFPLTDKVLQGQHAQKYDRFLRELFEETDSRIAKGLRITPGFIMAGLWWMPVRDQAQKIARNEAPMPALTQAISYVINEQQECLPMPARIRVFARDLLSQLPRFEMPRKRTVCRLLGDPGFRAAYDMLGLLARNGFAKKEVHDWWTKIQTLNGAKQEAMINVYINKSKGEIRRK